MPQVTGGKHMEATFKGHRGHLRACVSLLREYQEACEQGPPSKQYKYDEAGIEDAVVSGAPWLANAGGAQHDSSDCISRGLPGIIGC